jgi:DNA-binding NtrC family response regulator
MVHEFVRRAAARMGKDVQTVSAEAMTMLIRYSWPGNVRELEHAIERAVILARGTSITVRELPPELAESRARAKIGDTLDLKAHEQRFIEKALERFDGNRKKAAEALNLSPVTLWRKMKEYGLSS